MPFEEWRVWRDDKAREQIRKEAAAPFVNLLKVIGVTSVIPALILAWSAYQSVIFSQAELAVQQQLPLAMVRTDTIITPARTALTAQLTQWVQQEQTRREIFANPDLQQQVREAATAILSAEIAEQANTGVVEARRRRFLQEGVPDAVRLGVLADILDADSDGSRLADTVIELLDHSAAMPGDAAPALAFALSAGRTAVSLMQATGEAEGPRFAAQWQRIQSAAAALCARPGVPLPLGTSADLARIFSAFEPRDRAVQAQKLGRWLRASLVAAAPNYPAVCANALAAAAGRVGGSPALALARDLLQQRTDGNARAAMELLGTWVSIPADRAEAAAMRPTFDAALTTLGTLLAEQQPPHLARGELRGARIAWLLSIEAAMARRPRPDMLRYYDALYPGAATGMPAAFLRYLDRWRLAECVMEEDMPVECDVSPATPAFTSNLEARAWRASAQWLRDAPERLLRAANAQPPAQRAALAAQLASRIRDAIREVADTALTEAEDATAINHALELSLLAALDPAAALGVAEDVIRHSSGLREHPSLQYALRHVVLRNAGGSAEASRRLAGAVLALGRGRQSLAPLLTWLLVQLTAEDGAAAYSLALAAAETDPGAAIDRRLSLALLAAWAGGPRLRPAAPLTLRPVARPATPAAPEPAERGASLEERLIHDGAEELSRSLADPLNLAQAARLAAALHPLIRHLQPDNPDASAAASSDLWFLLLRTDLARPIAAARARQRLDPGSDAALARLGEDYWRIFARPDAAAMAELSESESRAAIKAGSVLRLEVPAGNAGRIIARAAENQPPGGGPHLVAVEVESRMIQGTPLIAPAQGGAVQGVLAIEPASRPRSLLLRIVGARESDSFEISVVLALALDAGFTATPPDAASLRALPVTPIPTANTLLGFTLPAGQASALVRLELPEGMLLEAETREPRGRDTIIELLDLDGRRLGFDDDGGSGDLLSRLVYYAQPRAVVLRFGLFEGRARQEASFLVRIVARADDPRRVAPGTDVSAELTPNAGEVVFAADLTAGQNLVARTANLSANLDTVLTLRNPAGTEIARDDDGGGGLASCLIFRAEVTGRHFFTVRNINSRASRATATFDFSLADNEGQGCAAR